MADEQMAGIARQLAQALNTWAKSRAADDLRHIAMLHTELCAAARAEEQKIAAGEEAVSS
jgi:hypothetical protein